MLRRLATVAIGALLVLSLVPLTSATATPLPRHVVGNFTATTTVAQDPAFKGMALFEVHTTSSGSLLFGYYKFEALLGPTSLAPGHSQGTVRGIRFFTDAYGAPGAEFIGEECSLAGSAVPAGTCTQYRVRVTDGASVKRPDTFCGGKASAAPGDADFCPYTFTILSGDIRIYSGV